jgi:hypothetical protein
MSEMTGAPEMSAQQPPIYNHRATDSGTEGEHHDVAKTARRADPRLRENRCVRVVCDRDEFAATKIIGPVETLESVQSAGHKSDRSPIARDEPRRRNSHGRSLPRSSESARIVAAHSRDDSPVSHVGRASRRRIVPCSSTSAALISVPPRSTPSAAPPRAAGSNELPIGNAPAAIDTHNLSRDES